MKKLVLASGSPRRQELLRREGIRFSTEVTNVPELEGGEAAPVPLAQENARRKAKAGLAKHPEAIVLGADTIVVLKGETLGKPCDLAQGAEYLRRLSGETHEVITAVALYWAEGELEKYESSKVTFLNLSEEDIAAYHRDVEVLDKAGGYAIQEGGERIIAKVSGCRDNVMGLPVSLVSQMLKTNFLEV